MKPDKVSCLNCGDQITKGKWCSDKCRKAYARNPDKQADKTNPDTDKSQVGQPTRTNDEFRETLTKTDKTFYDRAIKDFGEPYYNFDWEKREGTCAFCKSKYMTCLRLNRFCSYEHFLKA